MEGFIALRPRVLKSPCHARSKSLSSYRTNCSLVRTKHHGCTRAASISFDLYVEYTEVSISQSHSSSVCRLQSRPLPTNLVKTQSHFPFAHEKKNQNYPSNSKNVTINLRSTVLQVNYQSMQMATSSIQSLTAYVIRVRSSCPASSASPGQPKQAGEQKLPRPLDSDPPPLRPPPLPLLASGSSPHRNKASHPSARPKTTRTSPPPLGIWIWNWRLGAFGNGARCVG